MRQCIGAVIIDRNIFVPSCLLSKKLPINFAGMGGNGLRFLQEKDTFKSITRVCRIIPNHCHLPCHLISRYYLPFKCYIWLWLYFLHILLPWGAVAQLKNCHSRNLWISNRRQARRKYWICSQKICYRYSIYRTLCLTECSVPVGLIFYRERAL